MAELLDREQNLCEAVASWLNYKSLTGLRNLINESSIKVPISEYLSTGNKHEIQAEVAHPRFKKSTKGRPRQIDYVVKRNGNTWLEIYECKFHPDSPQRIIDDFCRLLNFGGDLKKGNPTRYFLYCGRLPEDSGRFDIQVNTGSGKRVGLFDDILSQDEARLGENVKVEIAKLDKRRRNLFADFCAAYEAELPEHFDTVLSGYAISGDYACFLWKLFWRRGTNAIVIESST